MERKTLSASGLYGLVGEEFSLLKDHRKNIRPKFLHYFHKPR